MYTQAQMYGGIYECVIHMFMCAPAHTASLADVSLGELKRENVSC